MIAQFEGDSSTPIQDAPTKSNVPDLKIVHRLGGIPIVADGIGTFEHVINSTQLTASLYATAGGIASKSLDLASPIISRTQPLIAKADGLANQGLDMVESRFPYPFKATTGEMVSGARGAYDQRVAGIFHNEIIQRAIAQITELKDRLASTGHSATEQISAITAGIVDQLYQITNNNKDLPAHVQENIGVAYNDIKNIVGEQEKTTQQKANEILVYVQSKVQPELEKLSNIVFKQKQNAAAKAEEVKAEAKDEANEVQDQVEEATS